MKAGEDCVRSRTGEDSMCVHVCLDVCIFCDHYVFSLVEAAESKKFASPSELHVRSLKDTYDKAGVGKFPFSFSKVRGSLPGFSYFHQYSNFDDFYVL